MMVAYFGFILLVAFDKPLLGRLVVPGLSLGILLGALVIVVAWVLIWIYVRWANRTTTRRCRGCADDVHHRRAEPDRDRVLPRLHRPDARHHVLGGAQDAARPSEFFAAGRSVTAFQNGLALAGDYMSAASFLGIAGLVSLSGFDGLIYSVGWLVGWPVVMFLIAEPLRNLGKYTFADVVAYRLRQTPVRIAAAIGTLAVVTFYLIAQMVGAGNLIQLLFGLPYELAVVIVGVVMLAYVLFGGMIATTWVQIVKAVLLLGGATIARRCSCSRASAAIRSSCSPRARRCTAPACSRPASWSPIRSTRSRSASR